LPSERQWLSTDYWRWQCPGPWTWGLIDQLRKLQESSFD
jgi:iron complex transport system substrate-binding protein